MWEHRGRLGQRGDARSALSSRKRTDNHAVRMVNNTVCDRDIKDASSTLNCILARYQTRDGNCRNISLFRRGRESGIVHFNSLAALYNVRQKFEIRPIPNAP